MLDTVVRAVATKPYLPGDHCTAADILWGNALDWGLLLNLVPETPVIADYVRRITGRPAALKVAELDARLAAEHQAAVDAVTPS